MSTQAFKRLVFSFLFFSFFLFSLPPNDFLVTKGGPLYHSPLRLLQLCLLCVATGDETSATKDSCYFCVSTTIVLNQAYDACLTVE